MEGSGVPSLTFFSSFLSSEASRQISELRASAEVLSQTFTFTSLFSFPPTSSHPLAQGVDMSPGLLTTMVHPRMTLPMTIWSFLPTTLVSSLLLLDPCGFLPVRSGSVRVSPRAFPVRREVVSRASASDHHQSVCAFLSPSLHSGISISIYLPREHVPPRN